MTRPRYALAAAAVLAALPTTTLAGPAREAALAHQLRVERTQHAHQVGELRMQARGLRARLVAAYARPDAEMAMRLAAIAYHQDWRHLRACALSEGYRHAERFQPLNARPNTAGSGAIGAFQFMPSTFAGTPYAGLPITRIDVQAHAAAWMWSQGRRGEWTGKGC